MCCNTETERFACPLNYDLEMNIYHSAHMRDALVDATNDAYSAKFGTNES